MADTRVSLILYVFYFLSCPFCCTSDKVTISGIFQGCVGITLQQWAQQPCCRAVCGLFVSGWRRQLCVRDMFLFPLPLSFDHASVAVIWVLQLQLDKGHCHCSPFSPFSFFAEDSLRHAYSNTTEDANNQFFTPHICDRRCLTCKIPCEVCVVVHGTDLRTVTLCEYLWTGLLSVLTKIL